MFPYFSPYHLVRDIYKSKKTKFTEQQFCNLMPKKFAVVLSEVYTALTSKKKTGITEEVLAYCEQFGLQFTQNGDIINVRHKTSEEDTTSASGSTRGRGEPETREENGES